MPTTPCSILVDPAGQTLAVTVRRNTATGEVAEAYDSEHGSNAAQFPAEITEPTRFFLTGVGVFHVSGLVDGSEAVDQAVTVRRGQMATVRAEPGPRPVARSLPVTIENHGNSTDEAAFASVDVPAGFATGDSLCMTVWGTLTSDATAVVYRLRLGGTAVIQSPSMEIGSAANTRSFKMEVEVLGLGTASQSVAWQVLATQASNPGQLQTFQGAAVPSGMGVGTATVDLSADTPLTLTAQWASASQAAGIQPVGAACRLVEA